MQRIECDRSKKPLPQITGFLRDPDDPWVQYEQYPPCKHRTLKPKAICGGTVKKPYCTLHNIFPTNQCITCSDK